MYILLIICEMITKTINIFCQKCYLHFTRTAIFLGFSIFFYNILFCNIRNCNYLLQLTVYSIICLFLYKLLLLKVNQSFRFYAVICYITNTNNLIICIFHYNIALCIRKFYIYNSAILN